MTTLAKITAARIELNRKARYRLGLSASRPKPHYPAPAWLTGLGAGRVEASVVEEPGAEVARDEIERLRAEARDARATLAAVCP